MEPAHPQPGASRRKLSIGESESNKWQKLDHASSEPSSLAMQTVLGSDDMLCLILTFMPAVDKCARDRCFLVTKQWNACCTKPAAWHSIRGTRDQSFFEKDLNAVQSRFEFVLPRLGRNLRVFECHFFRTWRRGDNGSCDVVFEQILDRCPQIRVLVHRGKYPRLRMASEKLKHLEELSILSSQIEIRDSDILEAITKVGGNLKSLRLVRTGPGPISSDRRIPKLVLPDLSLLCPKLETFSGEVNTFLLRSLSQAPSLKKLYLNPNAEFTNGLEDLVHSIGHQITDLVIEGGSVEDSARLFNLISKCSALQRVTLSLKNTDKETITTEQFAAFLSAKGHTLRELR
jgi:hypothetical protein